MPTATMSAQLNGLALFTVEQIELIRRLRNSGITKQQLVQAFDAMDQLDRELGPVYSLPITLQAIQQAAFQRHNIFNAQQAVNVVAANNAAITAAMVAAAAAQQQHLAAGQSPQTPQPAGQGSQTPAQQPTPQPQQGQAQQQQQQQPQQQQSQTASTQVSTPGQNTPINVAMKRPAEGAAITPQSFDLTNISIPNLSNGLMEFPDDGRNYAEEFRQFISLGEQYCCEQIRNFAMKYSIKQQQIATLAGVSQSYVSRFLKGDVYEMSERSRRAIQKWYIMYHNNPATIAPAVNAVLITNGSPPKKLAVEMSMATPNGDFVFQPKRERFVFRPNHLDILEKYFQIDNYPSQEKREEISQACNNATISMGRTLTEKETVTPQIIGNWFANKRKELKKIIREEGLDVSQVPLRPRGRPCRLLSDLVTLVGIDHGSNHSETASTDASMQDISPHQYAPHYDVSPQDPRLYETMGYEPMAQDQKQQPQHINMIEPKLEIRNNNEPQKEVTVNGKCYNGENLSENAQTPKPQEPERIPEKMLESMPENMPESMLENMPEKIPTPRLQEQDEEALSMSVEFAAVNQAILSLTGTQPIIIKPSTSPTTPQQMIVKQSLPTTQLGYGPDES